MTEQGHSGVRDVVGRNIRRERKRQGISLRVFAQMIGLSYTYISRIEHARQSITIDSLDKIAHGLGVDIAELFNDD